MKTISIVEQEIYDNKVNDVDVSGLTYDGTFHGTISIELLNGERKDFTGEHGRFDFADEYGFVINE